METQISPVMDKKAATKLRICRYLEEGMWFKDACSSAGVTEQTGHRYKREDVSFVSQVEASIAEYHLKLVRCVNQGALKNGWIALEVLKIRYPEEWDSARRKQQVDPQAELKKMKELIYERRSQNDTNRTL